MEKAKKRKIVYFFFEIIIFSRVFKVFASKHIQCSYALTHTINNLPFLGDFPTIVVACAAVRRRLFRFASLLT